MAEPRNRIRMPGDPQSRAIAGAIASIIALLGATYSLTGFPITNDFSYILGRGGSPDVIHERATAWEAIWGDPYRPIDQILEEHGYEGLESGGLTPRPPSALLLQTSLLLIPKGGLMPAATIGVLLLLVWIGFMVPAISGIEPWTLFWLYPLIIVSLPVIASIVYSPILGLLSVALLLASWRYQDRPWAGILLGVSTALRLWPGLVVVGFWISGRRKLAYKALVTFMLLNVAGLLLPRVGLEASIGSLLDAEGAWMNHNQNASIALVLWPYGISPLVSTFATALIGVGLALRHRSRAIPITLVAAVVASPLSWPAYVLAAVPVAAMCAKARSALPTITVAISLALWPLVPKWWIGRLHFFALMALFVLLVQFATVASRREQRVGDARAR